jgi:glycosyltransferase involved in cell wall biosynthesis
MSMKTIIFYSRSFYTGGMENAVYNLIRLLNKTKEYKITIAFRNSNEKTEKMLNKLSTVAKVVCIQGNDLTCDVLINCDRKDFELPMINAKKTIHWFSSCLIQNIENIQGRVISQSNYHRDRLDRLHIKSTVIGNALDVGYIIEQAQERVDIGRVGNETIYLVVSRISHEKGFKRITEFMLKHLTENCRLVVIGGITSDKNAEIKTMVDRYLRKKVTYLGELDNPYPYIAQADYVLCLSDSEIYGLVSEEAHILGKQVIFNRYESANDQFIPNFDMWYDMPIKKSLNKIDYDFVKQNNDRFIKWKEIIDE